MLTDFFSSQKTWVLSKRSGPQVPVGKLVDFVINPDTGVFEAFWINTPRGLKLLAPKDILRWHRGKILIADEGDFSDPTGLPRIQKIMEREIPILNAKVFSLRTSIQDMAQKKLGTKTYIGRVRNFSFDTLSPRIVTLIVHSGFLWWEKRRIIPRTRILKVDQDGVLVSENKIIVDEKPTMEGKKRISEVE
jgi:sporulation protein YlmC with PRC-barrel domain